MSHPQAHRGPVGRCCEEISNRSGWSCECKADEKCDSCQLQSICRVCQTLLLLPPGREKLVDVGNVGSVRARVGRVARI
jgi:hypothetical protein